MNNREAAIFILFGALLIFMLVKRDLRASLGSIARQMLNPKILVPLALFVGTTVGCVWFLDGVGLWSRNLVGSTLVWFLFVGLAWFIHLSDAGEQGFFRRRLLEAVGIGAFLEFFLNLGVLSLPGELVLQVVLAFLVMLSVFAAQAAQHKPVANLANGLLALIGLGLVIYTVRRLVSTWSSLDPRELASELVLPVALTLAAVPCIYLVALFAGYELVFMQLKLRNDDKIPPLRVRLGLVSGLRGSLRDLREFRGAPVFEAARAKSFTAGRKSVSQFKADRDQDRRERAASRERLADNAGVAGIGPDGLILDRREFAGTKEALRWLAMCQMGWYQQEGRPNTYPKDLLTRLGSFENHGLPGEHGIVMYVRGDGQAWYAYRSTPSGHVFAIGASGRPPSQWFYDGPRVPKTYPSKQTSWTSALEGDRAEWITEPTT